ncbi:hypothetical protein M407DRAFT_242883 [Tulasnella calospora MUT 4182]|uniref:Uncharacterized protein n=1 Tax=Tulasnella calospora MUT 4182 TaxID=1051891 RepID=A0A0C3L520_9AGAM|nr:hypothetical protein M407DRAFT_242883 [Tulasnella calospora MUT 4182]
MASATDRRRITGPESSYPPLWRQTSEDVSNPIKGRQGRQPGDIRPVFLKTGLVSQANGSSYIEMGQIKIVCAVYGPRQASKSSAYSESGRLNVEVKFAPFSCPRRRIPNKDVEDRDVSRLVQQSLEPAIRLELFPKSVIEVFITILETDGLEASLAAAAVAAGTALAHAGIELIGLVSSCSAALVDGETWLDPTAAESEMANGTVVVSSLPALASVTNIWQTGQLSTSQMARCSGAATARCADIHQIVGQVLRNNISVLDPL